MTSMSIQSRLPLPVFLCHSSGDKPAVRDLCRRLKADGFEPWLDEQKLLPGQDWQGEIRKAVRNSGVVIVCLSTSSITKEGYLQKELKYALDMADEKPEGTIFIIPLKLQECELPHRLSQWQWANLYEAGGYERLLLALKRRADAIESTAQPPVASPKVQLRSEKTTLSADEAKVMVVIHDFYDAQSNPGGRGVTHEYEVQVFEGSLVVRDHAAGLMWQRDGSGEPMACEKAQVYTSALNARRTAGFADWRVPTLEEAMSLMTPAEAGQSGEVMLGTEKQKGLYHIDRLFEARAAPFIWTADLQSAGRGWIIYFWDGTCRPEDLLFNAYVRAVRADA